LQEKNGHHLYAVCDQLLPPSSLPPSLPPYLRGRKREVTGVLSTLDKEHIDHAHAALGEQILVLGQDTLNVGDDLREGGREGGRKRGVILLMRFHGPSPYPLPPSLPSLTSGCWLSGSWATATWKTFVG